MGLLNTLDAFNLNWLLFSTKTYYFDQYFYLITLWFWLNRIRLFHMCGRPLTCDEATEFGRWLVNHMNAVQAFPIYCMATWFNWSENGTHGWPISFPHEFLILNFLLSVESFPLSLVASMCLILLTFFIPTFIHFDWLFQCEWHYIICHLTRVNFKK